jgi:hypothetical protein
MLFTIKTHDVSLSNLDGRLLEVEKKTSDCLSIIKALSHHLGI